jgi:hypothetical protein
MFISPQTIYWNKRVDTTLKNNESIQIMKDISFEYVSIKETINKLLENDNINAEINQSATVVDKYPKDYYKTHPLFKDRKCLKILLYYDGLQMTNALGDTNGVYKAGMFYFAIENLTRRHNSCLKNIFLIAILYEQDIKAFGFEKILTLIMIDISDLEVRGVQVNKEIYRASIAQFVADNLGIHEIFGLKCCFRGEDICHLCNASTTTIQTQHSPELFERYTKIKYNDDIDRGKYKQCLLNQSKFYHITENYAFDLTHDLWQGVVPLELSLLFKHLIKQNSFELEFLNMRLSSFSYLGTDRLNKPNPILRMADKTIKVQQKAAKMACLFRVLPFVIADKISITDEHWQLYLILSKIIDIVYTREISVGVSHELELLVRKHHENFKSLYPEITLKKKHHNMIHYGESIRRLGNLVDYSTIRFEAKHSYFKTSFETSNNTINIPKHLAYKHQTTLAYNLIKGDQLNTRLLLIDAVQIKFKDLQSNLKLLLLTQIQNILENDELKLSNSFEYFGLSYKRNIAFIYNEDVENFCKLNYIIGTENEFYIIATILESTGYNEHYHAYEVFLTQRQVILNIDKLSNSYPISINKCMDAKVNQDFIRPQSFII